MKKYSIIIKILLLIVVACNSEDSQKNKYLVLPRNVTLNKSNIYQISNKAKMYLYLFNVDERNNLGVIVDSTRKKIPLLSCEPLVKYIYTKRDTVCLGLYFNYDNKTVVSQSSSMLEFHFLRNELVTLGSGNRYLLFDNEDQLKKIIDERSYFLHDYLEKNTHKLSDWLINNKSEYQTILTSNK